MFATRLNPTKPTAAHRAVLERLGAACRELRASEDAAYLQRRVNSARTTVFARQTVLGIGVATEYEGAGDDPFLLTLAAERLGREGASPALFFARHAGGAGTVARWGTAEQKQRWLPLAARGEFLFAFALAEPRTGSNLDAIGTTFEATSAGFAISGEKAWVVAGDSADGLVTFARDRLDGRLSAFLVRCDQPGYRTAAIEHLLGLQTIAVCDVSLSGCEVPADQCIGERGNGAQIAAWTLMALRLCTAATSVGTIADCLEEALSCAKHKTPQRQAAAAPAHIDRYISQVATGLETARAITYSASQLYAELLSHPTSDHLFRETAALINEAKYFSSRAAHDAAQSAVQILGAEGYLLTSRSARHLCDSRAALLYDGASDLIESQIAAYYLQD